MSLQFLVAVLNWLEGQFVKAADKHTVVAELHAAKIAALTEARQVHLESVALAKKLANKIDNLLSE